jgi:hypothetical protein
MRRLKTKYWVPMPRSIEWGKKLMPKTGVEFLESLALWVN